MSSTSEPLALPAAKARWSREAKVISLIAVAHFMSHVHGMLLPPILGQVKEAFGVTYTQVALAITVFNIASALLQTPAGFLVDRIGARAMLTGGLILSGVGITAAALLPGYWFFIIAYGLMGVANTVYHPADYSILSAAIDGKKIGKAFSIHTFAGYLGFGVTPAMVLATAAHLGLAWRLPVRCRAHLCRGDPADRGRQRAAARRAQAARARQEARPGARPRSGSTCC